MKLYGCIIILVGHQGVDDSIRICDVHAWKHAVGHCLGTTSSDSTGIVWEINRRLAEIITEYIDLTYGTTGSPAKDKHLCHGFVVAA